VSQLRVENVSKLFGGVHAVRDLTFEVPGGMVYSIIGPNGAGKTTLFNLITGLHAPSAGRIWFEDKDVTGLAPYVLARRGMSRTFQNLEIFTNMSALENVMIGRHLRCETSALAALFRLPGFVRHEAECRDRAFTLLDFVGVGRYADLSAAAMPYGALKRLEIARALAAEPRLLLLDEPAAGLNPTETVAINSLIRKVAESGVTVVLVEHDMRLVMDVSERILVLDHGTKLAEGSAAEVRANPDVVAAYLGHKGSVDA